MNTHERRRISLFAFTGVLFAALAVTACQPAEGPAERAGKQVDQAAERVGDQVDRAADKAKDKVDQAKR
jgi:glutamine synthetase type III